MKSFNCIITAENGIHARPAGMIVKEAKKFISSISVIKGDNVADAKGLFSLMGLGIKNGDELLIKVDGEDEEIASEEIQKFFNENFCSGGDTKDDGIKG